MGRLRREGGKKRKGGDGREGRVREGVGKGKIFLFLHTFCSYQIGRYF